MFNIIKKLLMARELNMEEGQITILGQTVVMQPLVIWVKLQKELEKRGMGYLVYVIAKDAGKEWLLGLKKHSNMSINDLVNWGVSTISFSGWGKTSILNYDQKNKRGIAHVSDSTFAKMYGPSRDPVDHVVRGFAAAAGCIYFGEDVDAVETKCISTGSNICEFIVKKYTAASDDSEIVKKQLPFLFKEVKKT